MQRLFSIVRGGALLLLAGSLITFPMVTASAQDEAKQPMRKLTVIGQGEVKAKPDKADINIGVVTENRLSKPAVQQNAEASQAVQSALKRLGIPDKDVQTSNYNVQPVMDYQQGKKPLIIGYRVYNQVRVTIRKLEMVGDVIDAATNAGSNTIEGIAFGIEDDKALVGEAIDEAVQDARSKADRLAKAAGVSIVGIYEINEGGIGRPMPLFAARGGAFAAEAAAPTPIQPGELTISANVTIVYQLAPTMKAGSAKPSKKQMTARR